jgi:hypothetical protein
MKKPVYLILEREKELNQNQNQSKVDKSQIFKNARWEQLYKLVKYTLFRNNANSGN